jgi:eukaryotic-like serine/threonine-protein kinase
LAEFADRLKAALAGRYAIDREIGRGGMATVYLARDLRHERAVAVKVLHPEIATALGPERFLDEIRIAARLQHPHLLPLLDSGEAGGFLYYVMPYVEGESLRERLDREHELPVPEAVRILKEVVDALAYAHGRGVVHRDIKPDNVMLSGRHAMVTDFGVAKAISGATGRRALTTVGMALGTPAYMAPEQATADPNLDHRVDIYAVGVLAYELLAGRTPFTGATAQATLAAQVTEQPEPVTRHRAIVPAELAAAVMRCLEKKPADRWQRAEDLLGELEAVTAAAGVTGPAVPGSDQMKRPRPGVRVGAVVAAGAAAAVLIAAWLLVGPGRRVQRAAPGVPRLVVLPFENLGAPSDEYFADGLTDEITGKLAGLSGLGVIARTSAVRYKRTAKDPRQIGQELRVDYVLEGTVRWDRTSGGRGKVRVTPHLIRASDQTEVWAEPFDGAFADVFRLQGEIAERVATGMNVILLARDRQTLVTAPTTNQDAYDDYLKGNPLLAQGSTEANLRSAIELYQRAITLDPAFAAAYRQLSAANARLYASFDQTDQRLRLAREAADRALQLRPEEGQWALGVLYGARGEWRQALEHLKVAEELRPNESGIIDRIADAYLRLGDWSHASAYLERAVNLDPQSAVLSRALSFCYQQLFRFDEAIQYADRAIAIEPGTARPYVGIIFDLLLWKGRTAETDSAVARALGGLGPDRFIADELAPGPTPWLWASAFATHPRFRAALEAVRLAGSSIDSASWYLSAGTLRASLGDTTQARAYADSARLVLERRLRRAPGNADLHSRLGVAYASLGLKEAAIREARRAVDLAPDPLTNPDYRLDLGVVYAMVGEREAAIETLASVTDTLPSNYTRMFLRAIPLVATLLNDSRLKVLPLPVRN